MDQFLSMIQPYLWIVISYANFAREHILSEIASLTGTAPEIAKLIVISVLIYIFFLYLVGKIHQRQERKALKRLEAHSLKTDALLAEIQLQAYMTFQAKGSAPDCSWINDLFKKRTYLWQEALFASSIQATDFQLLKWMKRKYNRSKMRASIRWWILVVCTIGFYKVLRRR
jgi:hypothetical protein